MMNAWTRFKLRTTQALEKKTLVDTEYSSLSEGVQRVMIERPCSLFTRLHPVTSPTFVIRLRVRKIDGLQRIHLLL